MKGGQEHLTLVLVLERDTSGTNYSLLGRDACTDLPSTLQLHKKRTHAFHFIFIPTDIKGVSAASQCELKYG